jgi:nicotinamidase-related amidase
MRLILTFSFILLLFSCSEKRASEQVVDATEEKSVNHSQSDQKQSTPSKPKPSSNYTFFTHLQTEGWGYSISEKGKRIIDQQTIPGVPGNQGFQTSEDAQKVAELVIEKLEKGAFPPTVLEEELQKLGISWRN